MIQILANSSYSYEKGYIINVMLGDFLGLDYKLKFTDDAIDYTFDINGKKLVIKESFLWKQSQDTSTYLHSKNIPQAITYLKGNQFTSEADLPILYGTDSFIKSADTIDCALDIFASSFFMLTRWEEFVLQDRDQHNRFPAKASLAYKNDFHRRPIVNEYTEFLWNMLQFLGVSEQRKTKQYSFTVTHDVDSPIYWKDFSVKSFIKDSLRILLKPNRKVNSWLLLNKVKSLFSYRKDLFFTFDFIMSQSEKKRIKSHFFFMSGGKTRFDNRYKIVDAYIKQLIREIEERGHLIGIHPSYDAYNDKDQMQLEIDALQEVAAEEILTGREHYLRFEVPKTWQLWNKSGMKWDSTMGYAEEVGFRAGTCYTYPVFDILDRKELQLKEKPLIAMEVSLYTYLNLNFEDIKKTMRDLVKKVQKYNGEFVFLWHNSHFFNGENISQRKKEYIELLELCTTENKSDV